MNRSESRSKSSQKRDKTRASQASAALALPNAASTPQSDKPAGEVPQNVTKSIPPKPTLYEVFGSDDPELVVFLMLQSRCAAGYGLETSNGNRHLAAQIHSVGPRDGVEAMLAAQMVAVHNLSMNCFAAANMKGQTDTGIEVYLNRANRLLRTYVAQVQTLRSYRSKGEQHFTVEHVHVHDGGQAVVGTINQGHAGTRGANGTRGGGKGNVEQ